jgi:hypothetical protein
LVKKKKNCQDYARLLVAATDKSYTFIYNYIDSLNTNFSKLVKYLLTDNIDDLIKVDNDVIISYITSINSNLSTKKILTELLDIAKTFEMRKLYAPGSVGAQDAKEEFEKFVSVDEKTKKRKLDK